MPSRGVYSNTNNTNNNNTHTNKIKRVTTRTLMKGLVLWVSGNGDTDKNSGNAVRKIKDEAELGLGFLVTVDNLLSSGVHKFEVCCS